MSERDPRGPKGAWLMAWSLQGAAAGGLQALVPEGPLRFALLGVLSGLPLLGLYLWLGQRLSPPAPPDDARP